MTTSRELASARYMRALLQRFPPRLAVAIAVVARRGANRCIHHQDALILIRLLRLMEMEAALRIALRCGFFRHMDRPLLPGLSFDLNAMSDNDCISRFRFDHAGLRDLIVCLGLPSVIRVPPHADRIGHVEAICLILDRCTYVRKWRDLSQRYNRHTSALSRIFKYLIHKVLQGMH
jgi:hypothetical protein